MLDLKEPPGLLLHGRHKPYWKTGNNEMKIFFSIIALYIWHTNRIMIIMIIKIQKLNKPKTVL